MNVVFLGSGAFAVPILEQLAKTSDRYPLVRVVTRPDRPAGRGNKRRPTPVRVRAEELGLAVDAPATVNDAEYLRELASLSVNLVVVADYGELIRKAFRELPSIGIYNLHGSLLPAHRGAAPVVHALLDGDAVTGVTLFRIEAGLDSGPVVASSSTEICPLESAAELEPRLAELAAELIVETLPAFASGEFTETPQNEAEATLAPKIVKADARVDWSRSAEELARHVAAYNPDPGAFTYRLGGKRPDRTVILRARPLTGEAQGDVQPGTVVAVANDGIAIACSGGCLIVERLQRAGKAPLAAREYLRGARLEVGARFGEQDA